MSDYDSRPETYEHITRVRELLLIVVAELLRRAHVHDQSKLEPPEVEVFDRLTPRLKTLTYGTDEYRASLAEMGPALAHHYELNRHHPEHFGDDGILGMNLVDVVEMLCDWKAASERMKDRKGLLDDGAYDDSGIRESVATINAKRFGYDDQLKALLLNTLDVLSLRGPQPDTAGISTEGATT